MPPQGVNIVEGPPPSAPPAPTSEIHVTPGGLGASQGIEPPRPGSAREKAILDLRRRAKGGTQNAFTTPPEPEKTPEPAKTPEPDKTQSTAPSESSDTSDPPKEGQTPEPSESGTPQAAPSEGKPGKVNPWKLVEEYKKKASTLEQELATAKSSVVPEADRKTLTEKMTQIEKRNAELEDAIRFVDYKQSKEFQETYQKPYEDAWARAASDLKEIRVSDPATNETRQATVADLTRMVNMDLGDAREYAEATFGPFANDMMQHRKDIINLFRQQSEAIEKAKTSGEQRVKEAQERLKSTNEQIQKFVTETWTKSNETAMAHEKYGKFFKPVDGDKEVNQRLAKGFELVDRAFNESPMDPKLTPEQRRDVIERHAAVRNRAAAFGRLVYELNKAGEEVAALKKELEQFRSSEPGTQGGRTQAGAEASQSSAMSRALSELRKRAR